MLPNTFPQHTLCILGGSHPVSIFCPGTQCLTQPLSEFISEYCIWEETYIFHRLPERHLKNHWILQWSAWNPLRMSKLEWHFLCWEIREPWNIPVCLVVSRGCRVAAHDKDTAPQRWGWQVQGVTAGGAWRVEGLYSVSNPWLSLHPAVSLSSWCAL